MDDEGITGGGEGGRPHPSPVIRFFSCLIGKEHVPITVKVGDKYEKTHYAFVPSTPTEAIPGSICLYVVVLTRFRSE